MSNKLIENFYNNPCTPIKDGEVITSCNMDYNNINYANIPDNHKGCNQKINLGGKNIFENYNENAKINDFSKCTLKTKGCTYDHFSINNSDKTAEIDDGSCKFKTSGCTYNHSSISNHKPTAEIDDGSCNFKSGGCTHKVTLGGKSKAGDNIFKIYNDPKDYNFDASKCIPKEKGCTYEFVLKGKNIVENYNSNAKIDDGSCELYKQGCTDTNATNYESSALIDDGNCEYIEGCLYPDALNFIGNTPGIDLSISDVVNKNNKLLKYRDNGSCIFAGNNLKKGCTYKSALNADTSAKIDDGSCKFPNLGKDGCIYDINNNNYDKDANYDTGKCNFKLGCTYKGAENYNKTAKIDDGSCEFVTSGGNVIYQIIIILLILSMAGIYFMQSS